MKKYRDLICALIVVMVLIVIICTLPKYIKKQKMLEALTPTMGKFWASIDNIKSISTSDSGLHYEITDKEEIKKIMDILASVKYESVDVPENEKMAHYGDTPKTGLSLYINLETDGESWFLIIDSDEQPSDFALEHWIYLSYDVSYYAKSSPIYEEIRHIIQKTDSAVSANKKP